MVDNATDVAEEPPAEGSTARWLRLRIVGLSFLMLFVELALIRWTAANNLFLTHLTNFVLLASFLGVGLGFLLAESRHDLFRLAPVALAAYVAFILLFPVRVVRLSGGVFEGAFGMQALPRWVSLPVLFAITVWVMASVTQEAARAFARFPPLEAYRLDVLGSLAGIGAFAGLAFLQLPPLAWAVVAALGLVLLLRGPSGRLRPLQVVAAALVVVLLGAQTLTGGYHWSPYYKVRARQVTGAPEALRVDVNNVPHQAAYHLDRLAEAAPFYLLPYGHLRTGSPGRVLVIGTGTGNDVAVALAKGATRVDAVEIDPALHRLGRTYHPDRPYQDPRVTVHIDDGRAFLERTEERYDLIVLALTDALAVVSAQSSLRLENYLFTAEAMRTARSLLTRDGTFAMYNYYEPWLLDRYAGTVQAAYGAPPCLERGSSDGGRSQAVLTIGADGGVTRCAQTWRAGGVTPEAATDDHPFPYLAERRVPTLYLWVLAFMLAAALVAVRLAAGPLRRLAPFADLWCMGAAFLLLETKNVVQFALLFGTTWLVNAAVFAGVLASVLAAVEVARRVRLPRPWLLYGGLLLALVAAWAVPQAALLDLAAPLRLVAATVLAFTPIFLANLVFAQRFERVGSSTRAFGANLLGAMVGGMLEYLALLQGYRFLLVLVALLYGLAFASGRRHLALRP